VVYRADMPVAVGQAPMAWKRRDVRLDNLRQRGERLAAQWRQFWAWAGPHLAYAKQWAVARFGRAVEWTTTRLADTADKVRQVRTERAWRRMTPRLEQIEREREREIARVIALPTQREGDEDS